MNDDEQLAPGHQLGRYEVVRHLGSGGMGGVYEARHVDLDKRVAIKVLDRKLAKNKVYLERFLREGRLAAKLDHPNVVDVSDVGTHQGVPYLVMELLVGSDLDSYLDTVGRLDVPEAVDLLLPIFSALVQAHAGGLVHRDLKPANIYLPKASDGSFHPKLLDFGIAKPGDEDRSDLTATSDVFGTPQFMAPEQVRRSRDATARADQYSMGAVLYRAVTGVDAIPIEGSSVFELLERVVSGAVVPPSTILPELAGSLEPIILKAMSRRPDDRYPTMKAFGAALLPFSSPAAKRRWEAVFADESALQHTLAPAALAPAEAAGPSEATVRVLGAPASPVAASLVVSSRDLSARTVRPRRFPWAALSTGALATVAVAVFFLTRPPAGPAAGRELVGASADPVGHAQSAELSVTPSARVPGAHPIDLSSETSSPVVPVASSVAPTTDSSVSSKKPVPPAVAKSAATPASAHVSATPSATTTSTQTSTPSYRID